GRGEQELVPSGEPAAPQPKAPSDECTSAGSCRLPLVRVKALVEVDPNMVLKRQKAIFILAQALEIIAKDAYYCAQQGRRKTLQRRDSDNAIEPVDKSPFLEGALD
ncbi:hypothetical protein PANDA_003139, partial [Ailuropoda melanoleuca]